VLSQPTSNKLGDKYREDSIVIEPDAAHFDLEKPEVVGKHIEALLASIEVQPATAG
jgi:hypothetical protein